MSLGQCARQIAQTHLPAGLGAGAGRKASLRGNLPLTQGRADKILDLDRDRLAHLDQPHLIAEIAQQSDQLEELVGRAITEKDNRVRSSLHILGRAPEMVPLFVPQTKTVRRRAHLFSGHAGRRQVDASVLPPARQPRAVHPFPVIDADALGDSGLNGHGESRRVEGDPVLVRAAAETQLVVEALLEHPQPGNQGSRRRLLGDCASRHSAGQAPLAPNAAGVDRSNAAERQIVRQMADLAGERHDQTLGSPLEFADPGRTTIDKAVHPPGLLLGDPARLEPDAVTRFAITLAIERPQHQKEITSSRGETLTTVPPTTRALLRLTFTPNFLASMM